MILVDAMNVHQACAGPEYIKNDPNECFTELAYELINNAVKGHSIRSSNTGRPRKVEATPNLLTGNKRRKGTTVNWRKELRCCIRNFPQNY